MIEQLDIGIENALAYRIAGKISTEEATTVFNAARDKIAQYGKIVVLKQIDSFEGFDLGVITEEFKYLYDVGISNISRVAIVTDKKWLSKIVELEDKFFKNIAMKPFALDDMESAISFLTEASSDANALPRQTFIAMNRFKVMPGCEEEFLEVWRSRNSYLNTVPGFISFNMLQGSTNDEHTLFSSHVVWKSKDDFDAWTKSEAFRKAHAGAGGKKDIYVGPPQLECFTAVM